MEPRAKSPRRRRTQAERREQSTRALLQAAVELIGEKGFERTTAAEIGERAGFSRMMVRSRYGTKEGLLDALMRSEFEELMLPSSRDDGFESGLERALNQIGFAVETAEEDPDLMKAFLVLGFEAVGPVQSLKPWLIDWIERFERENAAALHAGQRDGSVRADIDPELEAQRSMQSSLGISFRWTLDPGADFAGRYADLLADLRARWKT